MSFGVRLRRFASTLLRRVERTTEKVPRTLQVGDRISLSGGYRFEPEWLSGKTSVKGSVVAFIPNQNDGSACVIKLDEPLGGDGASDDIAILKLRYVDASWGPSETVHIELCDFMPETKRWEDRRQGEWVESHATYKVLAD